MKFLKIETKKDRVESQIFLRDNGYYSGRVDGLWGTKSELAYQQYLEQNDLPVEIAPKGAIPWWKTRRGQGLFTLLLGGIAVFIPGFESESVSQITNIIWANIDSVELIIQKSGEVIAAAGLIWSIIGARGAKAPVDPNLVAKVGTHEIRLPKRIYESTDDVSKSVVDRVKGWFADS